MIIGLAGKARSGKDTAASVLVRQGGFEQYSFAWPLKRACKEMFGWTDDHVEGDLKEVVDPFLGFTPRYALQTLGTEWGRVMLRDDIWVALFQKLVGENPDKDYVIADVRFENEAKAIRDMGGAIVHIWRDASSEREGFAAAAGHASEAGIAFVNGDYELPNNGSLHELDGSLFDIYCAQRDKFKI